MPNFSAKSLEKLMECHPDLIRLFQEVVKEIDCSIICGHRNKSHQDEAFRHGFSNTPWPKSKHNKIPSLAVDCIPYPCKWDDSESFEALAKVVFKKANELGIEIVWGGSFKTIMDKPHYELKDDRP